MWHQLHETTDDNWVRNNAQLKLGQLDALDEIDALAAVVQRFAAGARHSSGRLERACRDPLARGHPARPLGTPYELKPDTPGGVALSEKSSLPPCRPSS